MQIVRSPCLRRLFLFLHSERRRLQSFSLLSLWLCAPFWWFHNEKWMKKEKESAVSVTESVVEKLKTMWIIFKNKHTHAVCASGVQSGKGNCAKGRVRIWCSIAVLYALFILILKDSENKWKFSVFCCRQCAAHSPNCSSIFIYDRKKNWWWYRSEVTVWWFWVQNGELVTASSIIECSWAIENDIKID